MATITREQAEKLLQRTCRQYKKIAPNETMSHTLHADNGTTLTYTELINRVPVGRVIVGTDTKGDPKIISSYHIGPAAPEFHPMERIKVTKSETKFVQSHGSSKREV